jgi:DNA-binding MarR family transcriptional regulator
MTGASQYRIDYTALAQFRYEIRRFLNLSEKMSQSTGLEPKQHQALLALKGLPPAAEASVSALAGRMLLRHNSAVELADRLESRGLLRRAVSPTDARQVLLQLTPRGNRALEKVSRPHQMALQTTGPLLISALQVVLQRASRKTARGRAQCHIRPRAATQLAITQRALPRRGTRQRPVTPQKKGDH